MRVHYPWDGEGWNQLLGEGRATLSMPLKFGARSVWPFYFIPWLSTWFKTWLTWVPVVPQTMDMCVHPSFTRNTDQDMTSSSLNLVVTMALCEVKESQIKLGPPLAWSSGSNMAPGGDPEPGHPCGLWSQTMEINTNVGHSKTIDPNMTLSSGPDGPGS